MIHVYIAHRLTSPNREENIEAAGRLLCELADRLPIVPYASWITLARYWDESKREKGLAIDKAQIARCDELWHTGPELSSGMFFEGGVAVATGVTVHNLIGMTADEIVEWWCCRGSGGESLLAKARPRGRLTADCFEALLWCSGSPDFQENGVARNGWARIVEPVLTRLRTALGNGG